MSKKPPSLADKFLQWYCKPEILEFLRGDLHELYLERVGKDGKFRADLAFIWDVIRCFRLSNFRRPYKTKRTMMIGNYLKVGFRNLRKKWAHSMINISGLSLSVGCALTTLLFADFFFNLNTIHKNRDNTYQVVSHLEENGKDVLYGPSPTVIGQSLKELGPNVEDYVRLQFMRGNVKFEDNVFRELITFTDPQYLKIFDFPLEAGDMNSLNTDAIFLSAEMAVKYFGKKDPMGQTITIKFGEEKLQLSVAGVFDLVPENTTFMPSIVTNIQNYKRLKSVKDNWIDESKATFVTLNNGETSESVSDLLNKFAQIQNEANPSSPVTRFELISLTELSDQSQEIQDGIVHGNDRGGTIGIAVTGIFLILFACLNYVNIAISSASTRLKEIGVRKVLGGSRSGIAQQFLVENFLLCAIAMILGALSCYFLLLPGFNQISPVAVPFSFSSWKVALLIFVGIFFVLGLLSGSYPSFYISKFQSLDIFRSERQLGGKGIFSKVLLTIQFFLGFITILGSFIFTDNAQYVKKIGWGYEPKGILALPIDEEASLLALKEKAELNPDIVAVTMAKGHVGVNNNLVPFSFLEQQFKVLSYEVEPGYLDIMGFKLLEGELLGETSSNSNGIVVNKLFVDNMGWDNALGQSVVFNGERRYVLGVVSDIYHTFFDNDIQRPMIFSVLQSDPGFLIIKTSDQQIVGVNESLKESWKEISPFDPYNSIYQSDIFNRAYSNVDANIWFMLSLSVFTIILSCLGLYGLLAYSLIKRMKEFSIRKVLGANKVDIIKLANKEFVWILLVAFATGMPLGIWLMQDFTERFFSISKPVSVGWVVSAILIMLLTVVISVFAQVRKVVKVNPASTLRGE